MKETISIKVSPESRAMMLGARANSILGDRAWRKVLNLDAGNLRILASFATVLADIKEQEEIK